MNRPPALFARADPDPDRLPHVVRVPIDRTTDDEKNAKTTALFRRYRERRFGTQAGPTEKRPARCLTDNEGGSPCPPAAFGRPPERGRYATPSGRRTSRWPTGGRTRSDIWP